jgi:hypothetical protein
VVRMPAATPTPTTFATPSPREPTMSRHASLQSQHSLQIARWRSRFFVIAFMTIAVSIYLLGIAWFGQGLAEDMRAGVREVRPGALIAEHER